MKISQLKIKNLGPFHVKPVELDFENGTLASASLLAITGPTGSGKTTLFDAICVALYGKTPRLAGIGDRHPRHLLSHNKNEGHVEVTFEANGIRYLAEWSIVRAGPPSRRLIKVDTAELITGRLATGGKSLVASQNMVSEEIESILGLNFDSFKRSVMLAQGEFAAFLKAGPAEKLETLAATAGIGIYDALRVELSMKMGAVRAELGTVLRQPTNILEVVNLPELATAKDVLRELNDILGRNGNPRETCEEFVSKHLNAILGVLRKQVSGAKESLCSLKKDASALADQAEEYKCQKRREEERTEAFEELQRSEKRLCELLARAQEIAALVEELKRANLANQLLLEKLAYDSAKSEWNRAEAAFRDAKTKRNEAQNDLDQRRTEFDKIDDAYQTSLAEYRRKKAAYDSAILDVRLAQDRLAQADALITDRKELDAQIGTLSNQLTEDGMRQTELENQTQAAEAFLKANPLPADRQARLKLRELEVLVNPIKTLRQRLETGEPCLVCGAIEHPHAHEIAGEIGSATESPLWDAIPDDLHGGGLTFEEALSQVVKRIDAVEVREQELQKKRSQLRELDLTIQAAQRELDVAEDARNSVLANIEGYQREGNASLTDAGNKTSGLTTEAEIETSIGNLDATLQKMTEARSETEQGLNDSKTSLTEAQATYNYCASRRDECEGNLKTASETYLEKLRCAGFDSPEDHNSAFRKEEWMEGARTKIAAYYQEIDELKRAIAKLSSLFEEPPFDPGKLGRITAKLEKIQAAIQAAQRNIGAQESKIAHLKDALAKFTASAEKVRKAYEEFARWDNLRMTIAHPNPKSLSNFALRVVLEQVSQFANTQLEYLTSGRYQLKVETVGEFSGIKLTVVDKWNANEERPVETLSGGESFLTSFALALGLSELSRGRAQINSLFLDEGFGTLDAETLDTVINALEGLRLQGRSVFLISHIEKLTRHLPVEIRVRKGRNGSSTVDFG